MKSIFVVGLCFFSFSLMSQDRLGLANSNYMPVTTALNNPSSIVDAYTWLDINLVGASVFFENNYLYIPGDKLTIADRFKFNFSFDQGPRQNLSHFDKNFFVDATVALPSASVVIGRQSGGWITNFRTMVDLEGVPYQVAQGLYSGFANLPQFFGEKIDAKNLRISQMSWLETGPVFGSFVYSFDEDVITVGASVKKLWGITGIAAKIDKWNYTTVDKNVMAIDDFKATVAGAVGFGSGSGWSADFGITYKRFYKWSNHYRPNDVRKSCNRMPYRFKITAAILDLGSIKFDKDATLTTYENGKNNWQNYSNSSANSVDAVTSFFSQMFTPNTVTTTTQNSFTMGLPTSISAGFDYNLGYGFYAGANTMIGLPNLFLLGPQRQFQLALVPRYERKFFEMSIPISTLNFQDLRIGLMMRMGFITIGTDRLNTFLFGDVYAADFFLLIKMPFHTSPKCEDLTPKRKLAPYCPQFR
ncbi:MAG: DUF5723 family protein [Bacteroidetes bacterium]|nr:DUF5723 family protein [Bacteroidota bacterium]